MLPISMNEFLQQKFAGVGMQIDFDEVEWGAIRSDPNAPESHGDQGINISLSSVDPSSMFRYYAKDSFSPTTYNWGHSDDATVTAELKQAQSSFDPAEQTRLLAAAHGKMVDQAPWLFFAYDINPRDVEKGPGFRAVAELVRRFHPDFDGLIRFTRRRNVPRRLEARCHPAILPRVETGVPGCSRIAAACP
ncbi:hypothetical protein [Rhodopila sp.]|uniref:hypothetical protein n=1 Tax=Rhodopila sp. TaxID=2480087 RepID=UPI003D0EA956